MQLQLQQKHLPQSLKRTLLIFSTANSFIRHLLKHVLIAPESVLWRRLLPSQTPCWRELAKERYTRITVDDIISADDKLHNLIQSAYDDLARCIEIGLGYADETPLYALLKERVENPRTGKTWVRETYVCLSSPGFIMYVRTHALRSAFFAFADARSHAPYDLYWAGLHKILAQAQRVEACISWYSEEEGFRLTGLSVERMTRDTLTQSRNPWPKPKAAYKNVRVVDEDPLEALIRHKYSKQ